MVEANARLLEEGFKLLGTKEVPGYKADPYILSMLKRRLPWVTRDEVNWCGAAMEEVAVNAGAEITGKKLYAARLWRHEGISVETPKPGDVVVFWREHRTRSWKGHVGIFLHKDKNGMIHTMGGNQLNEYNVRALKDRVLYYRRLFLKQSNPPLL